MDSTQTHEALVAEVAAMDATQVDDALALLLAQMRVLVDRKLALLNATIDWCVADYVSDMRELEAEEAAR